MNEVGRGGYSPAGNVARDTQGGAVDAPDDVAVAQEEVGATQTDGGHAATSAPTTSSDPAAKYVATNGLHSEAQQSANVRANADVAARNLDATATEVTELGKRIADAKGPASEEDRAAWQQGQAKLRAQVTALAEAVSTLPPDALEREAARAQLARVSEQLAAFELPVLAKLDVEMGKSWDLFTTDKGRDSEGAALPQRLKLYGLTREDLNRYVLTGQEPAGLKRALADAQRRGEWPSLGVVRAAYMMRADYLRATSAPDDAVAQKIASSLDATATTLTQNRAAIHMSWGTRTAAKILQDESDPAKRTKHQQQQLDEAKRAISSVRARAVEQVTQNPSRYGKDSATRTLAADSLATEANITQAEARSSMDREAKKLADATTAQNKAGKPEDPRITPPPAQLHPDLAEGGTVDSKRNEAVKIDPRLADVARGGDRAVQFTRDVIGTRTLRLANAEQQIAHLKSKQIAAGGSTALRPPAELVAKYNTQLEKLYQSTIETHDRLTREKPGSLGVEQTRLLAELGGQAHVLSSKVSTAWHQKHDVQAAQSVLHEQKLSAEDARANVQKQLGEFQKAKIERIGDELKKKAFSGAGRAELEKFNRDPAAYAESKPDNKVEAPRHAALTKALNNLDKVLPALQKQEARATDERAYMQKVDDLDGLSTDAEMAAGLAKDALARADAHMAAIPAKGAERGERLQAAIDHQAAVVGVAAVVRDNADARIARTNLNDLVVRTHYQRETPGLGQDPIGRSAEFAAKVTADETAVKRGALDDAKKAVTKSESLRTQLTAEIDRSRDRPSAVEAQKDALVAQQARLHGAVAELAADLDPKEAKAQLAQAERIVKDEMPYTHVARLDTQQAEVQHRHNEARAYALASVGEAGIAVANRASQGAGTAYGELVVDALGTAHRTAADIHHTLTIDGGGAAEATANKERHADLRARADGLIEAGRQIDRSVDAVKLADSIDRELYADIGQFNEAYRAMAKDIDSRDFGYALEFVSGAMAGFGIYERSVNDEAEYVGMQFLNLGAGKGNIDTQRLHGLADQIRAMHNAGVPDHVIMASLRDPRLAGNATSEQRLQWQADMTKIGARFGAAIPESFLGMAAYVRTETPLGRVLESARSNGTGDLVAYVTHESTDLLGDAQAKLREGYENASRDWDRFTPYVAFGHVLDQVLLTVASTATFAGVFARVAAATTIPAKFAAARLIAEGLSAPAKIAMLAGINAAEAGLGMATGAAISKIGNGVFGEGTLGAKIFGVVGSGLQLNVGSAVAMRTGIAFQTTLGLTMGSVPIVAEQLGASPELAAKLGTAVGIFVPTVLGTISNYRANPRAAGVMVHELGVDPAKARGVAAEVTQAGLSREGAGQLVDARFKELSADTRAKLADTLTLDSVRARIGIDPPARGTPETYVREIDNYYNRLEAELVKQGVQPDRAHELVNAEKTTMYAEALATTNGLLAGADQPAAMASGRTPGGSGALTRQTAERLAAELPQSRGASGDGRPRSYQDVLRDEIAQIGGIPRDVIDAQAKWPSLKTVEERVAFLREAVNARLKEHGIPELRIVELLNDDSRVGQYTIRQHEIAITKELLRKPTLSRDDVIRLSDVIRHEVEHAVQWVDMARVFAAQGKDAAQIAHAMGRGTNIEIAEQVANWAVAQEAANNGIDLSSTRAQVATLNHGSVYGLRKNFEGMTRKQVYDELRDATKELALRDAAYKRAKGTSDEKLRLAEWGAALRREQDANYAYQSLSEEHGAHVAGHLAAKEAEILTDPETPGANDFENAKTRVYEGVKRPAEPGEADTPPPATPHEVDDAPTGQHRAALDDAPTGQHRVRNGSGNGSSDGGSGVPPANVGGNGGAGSPPPPPPVDTGASTGGSSVNSGRTTNHNVRPSVDTNGSTATGGGTVNTGGQTVDTAAPVARPRRPQVQPGEILEGRPIAPVKRPPDDQVFRINTVNGPVEMTAGEYRDRHRQAQKWVSEQLQRHHWSGAGNGQSVNYGALQEQAAAIFGLDRHWQRVGNPIVNGKL